MDFSYSLDYNLLGMRIKKARLTKSLTQEKLAELVNVSTQHISHIENSGTMLSLPCLVSICNALEITADNLLLDSLPQTEIKYLLNEVSEIFADCTPDEIFLMLSQAENLKKSLRLKNMKAVKEQE